MPISRKSLWFNRLSCAVFVAIAVMVLVRAAIVCNRVDGGWAILRDHITAGLPPPFQIARQSGQGQYLPETTWMLAQADRLLSDPHATATDLIGAAIVLGTYNMSVEIPNVVTVGATMWRPWPWPQAADESQNDGFPQLQLRSRGLAGQATKLEPNNPDWWRLRVMLSLFYWSDWHYLHDLIRESMKHDPDNALYPYLLGYLDFGDAWKTLDDGTMVIDKLELFQQSKELFEQALAKPLLSTGQTSATVAAHFLEHAKGSVQLKFTVYTPRSFDSLRSRLVQIVQSPLNDSRITDMLNLSSGPTSNSMLALLSVKTWKAMPIAAWFMRQPLQTAWFKQWEASHETLWEDAARAYLNSGQSLSADKRNQLSTISSQMNNWWFTRRFEGQEKLPSVIAVAASSAAWMLFILAAMMYGLFRWRAWRTNQTKDDLRTAPKCSAPILLFAPIWWLVLFSGTFFIFGFMPAYDFWPRKWNMALAIGAAVVILPTVGWILWRIGRFIIQQGRMPRQQREPYYQLIRWGSVIVVGAVFVIGMQVAVDQRFRRWAAMQFDEFPSKLITQITEMHFSSGQQSWLPGNACVDNFANLPWSMLQWGAHGGLWITTGIWLFFVLVITGRRAKRLTPVESKIDSQPAPENVAAVVPEVKEKVSTGGSPWDEEDEAVPSKNRRLRTIWKRNVKASQPKFTWRWQRLRPAAVCALLASGLMATVCVAATTVWIDSLEHRYQHRLAQIKNPGLWIDELKIQAQENAKAVDLSSGN